MTDSLCLTSLILLTTGRSLEKLPDFSVLTNKHRFLHYLTREAPIFITTFLSRLASCWESTRFLLKSVVICKFRECILVPQASPSADEALTGTGHVAAATGLFITFFSSFH